MNKPEKYSVALVIKNQDGQVLAVQRPAKDELGAVWGFPAATQEHENETWEEVAHRVAKEKLGAAIELGECIGEDTDDRKDYFLTLRNYEAVLKEGEEVVVPQTGTHVKGTQYTQHMWTDDFTIFISAARNNSVCTRIFLEHEGIDWKEK